MCLSGTDGSPLVRRTCVVPRSTILGSAPSWGTAGGAWNATGLSRSETG